MLKERIRILLMTALVACIAAGAQADLTSKIKSVIHRKSQKKVTFAVKIINASTGKSVYSLRSQEPMIPASNMKLVASAAALRYLGSDYQFKTHLAMLEDTLVIIGGGDPLLGDEATNNKLGKENHWLLDHIAETLKKHNITSIKDIVIDSVFFDDNRVCPNWPVDQLNRWYACEISGVNYNGNCIKVRTRKSGGRVKVTTEPNTGYVHIINKVKAISKGSSAVGAYRSSVPNKIIVKGKCNRAAAFDVAIERPAAFFGFLLAEKLTSSGINVTGSITEKYIEKNSKLKILKTYSTPILHSNLPQNISQVWASANLSFTWMTAAALAEKTN